MHASCSAAPTLSLCCRVQVALEAAPIDIIHYTVDVDDQSCGLSLSTNSGSVEVALLMNQPTPRRPARGASAAERRRWVD